MILVVTAPSGAGKTTIVRRILGYLPKAKFSVSATTRNKRENEVDGRDYCFITPEEFRAKIKNHEFVEWEEVHGNYYGTLKKQIDDSLDSNQDILLDIDVKGALSIKKLYPEAVTIFISVPKEELIRRLEKRKTESEEQIKKRAERIEFESALKDNFDYAVENLPGDGGLDTAVKKVEDIINKHKAKQNGN
jgi:guanylate kinase